MNREPSEATMDRLLGRFLEEIECGLGEVSGEKQSGVAEGGEVLGEEFGSGSGDTFGESAATDWAEAHGEEHASRPSKTAPEQLELVGIVEGIPHVAVSTICWMIDFAYFRCFQKAAPRDNESQSRAPQETRARQGRRRPELRRRNATLR